MAGTYTVTLQSVIDDLGVNQNEQFRNFQQLVKGNVETLRMISDNTDMCFPKAILKQKFAEKKSETQNFYIDVNQPVTPGTGAVHKRIGTGGNNRVPVQVVAGTLIEEGLNVSVVNETLSRFSKDISIGEQRRLTVAYLLNQAFQNILFRLEAAAQAWIDANKAPTGGLGTFFSALGDYKEIPSGDQEDLFWKIGTEARENKIVIGDKYNLLGNNYMHFQMGKTSGYGTANSVDLSKSFVDAMIYKASELDPPLPATQNAVMYAVAPGGVGMYCKVNPLSDGSYEAGNDSWMTTTMPSIPMADGIDTSLIELHIKGYKGWSDTSATYTTSPEALIDIVESMSITTTPYFFKAYSPVAARQPIVGYVKTK